MKKKVIITVCSILVIIAAAALWFKLRLNGMKNYFESAHVTDIDLSSVENGTYRGEAGEFLVSVVLEVAVENHRITGIEVIDQKGGEGYEASEMLPRIIEAQSPSVDIVSGATASSRCIMIAVRNALTDQISW